MGFSEDDVRSFGELSAEMEALAAQIRDASTKGNLVSLCKTFVTKSE